MRRLRNANGRGLLTEGAEGRGPHRPPRRELPDRAGDARVNFLREIQHADVTGKRFLAFVIVITEANAEFVGDGPFLYAADEQVHILLQAEPG